MALEIEKETDFGVPALYWRFGYYADNLRARSAVVTLHGYASPEARHAECEPLAIRQVEISGENYAPGLDQSAVYAFVKSLPDFEGAIDV